MNKFVIADPRRCLGCYTCMAACIETHREAGLQASPRLLLTHTRFGTMPIQCRHCEDAPCAAVCPVHAIRMIDDSVRLNESLCIGCKLCNLVCPFGAAFLGGTPPATHEINTGQHVFTQIPIWPPDGNGKDRIEGINPILDWRVGVKTVAVKCDLCYFRNEGPACVAVCPTKALRLVDEQSLSEGGGSRRTMAVKKLVQGEM
jgi:hydrogenase-4 component A